MAKVKNPEYKQKNEAFMQALRNGEEELFEISQGVLVKIIKSVITFITAIMMLVTNKSLYFFN